jgi:hypothetical protein
MRPARILSLLSGILVITLCGSAWSAVSVPKLVHYQGLLTQSTGAPLADGSYGMTFRIFDASTGGSPSWSETQTVPVANGYYSVFLGSSTSLPAEPFFSGPQKYLEVQVNTETLAPRERIVSVPYAILAETVPDSSLKTEKVADGQVVRSLNGLKDHVALLPGTNVTITPTGNALTIAATGGGFSLPFAGTVNYFGSALAIENTDPDTGAAGDFKRKPVGAKGPALRARNYGAGKAIEAESVDEGPGIAVECSSPDNDSTALEVTHKGHGTAFECKADGDGPGGTIQCGDPGSTATAFAVAHEGLGIGMTVQCSNPNDPEPAFSVEHAGTGPTLQCVADGLGPAVTFQATNPSSSQPTLRVVHEGSGVTLQAVADGTGPAVTFQVANPGSVAPTLQVVQDGGGTGIITNSTTGAALIAGSTGGTAGVFNGGMFGTVSAALSVGGTGSKSQGGEGGSGADNEGGNNGNGTEGKGHGSGHGGKFTAEGGRGVDATSTSGQGGFFTGSLLGITGQGTGPGAPGVKGQGGPDGHGVEGTGSGTGHGGKFTATSGNGVNATSSSNTGGLFTGLFEGLRGQAGGIGGTGVTGNSGPGPGGVGIKGTSIDPSGAAVQGTGPTAAKFTGNVVITGNLTVTGSVSKGSGSFQIDHPLDPENKTLSHSFVESPDMMNVYNGNVTLDANGEAVVTLPEWFEALNRDFRYQLTAIGGPGPNLYVAEEVAHNQFKIGGGSADLRVSWQVTGVRQDAAAKLHRIPVEEMKTTAERGFYLDPKAYGKPVERGIDYARFPEMMRASALQAQR